MTSSPAPDSLSPAHARFLYWFNGLFPILTSVLTPFMVYRKVLKNPDYSNIQRYNQLVQEYSRQLVSGTIGLVSYFGGGEMMRGFFGLQQWWKQTDVLDDSSKHTAMIIGGAVASFIGYTFIRPIVSLNIIELLSKKENLAQQVTQQVATHSKALGQKVIAALPDLPKASPAPTRMGQKMQQNTLTPVVSPFQTARRSIEQMAQKAHTKIENFRNRSHTQLKAWVDGQIMQGNQPRLGRAAFLSTASLAIYLTALTAVIYGVSRLFTPKKPTLTAITPQPAAQSAMQQASFNPTNAPATMAFAIGHPDGGFQTASPEQTFQGQTQSQPLLSTSPFPPGNALTGSVSTAFQSAPLPILFPNSPMPRPFAYTVFPTSAGQRRALPPSSVLSPFQGRLG